jgi:hypothetical protein
MTRLPEIRAELADKAATALGVRGYPVMPDSVVAPCVAVRTREPFIAYQLGMGNSIEATYMFELLLVVGRAAEAASQDRLGEWLSPDGPLLPALNGRGSPFEVSEALQMGVLQIGEGIYAVASLSVDYIG